MAQNLIGILLILVSIIPVFFDRDATLALILIPIGAYLLCTRTDWTKYPERGNSNEQTRV